MNDKLTQIIFKKLYSDLSSSEIILHDDGSIWFIDREKKYWFLDFKKSGELWWRWDFFSIFFKLFSMERSEFEPIIVEWVEEVLNGKVVSSVRVIEMSHNLVEEVLNGKVVSSYRLALTQYCEVEEVLNGKVVSPKCRASWNPIMVEEVLDKKVVMTQSVAGLHPSTVEEVLNNKLL